MLTLSSAIAIRIAPSEIVWDPQRTLSLGFPAIYYPSTRPSPEHAGIRGGCDCELRGRSTRQRLTKCVFHAFRERYARPHV